MGFRSGGPGVLLGPVRGVAWVVPLVVECSVRVSRAGALPGVRPAKAQWVSRPMCVEEEIAALPGRYEVRLGVGRRGDRLAEVPRRGGAGGRSSRVLLARAWLWCVRRAGWSWCGR